MKRSDYLYGSLDKETAQLQLDLFKRKKAKAHALIAELRPSFNVANFTEEQRNLEFRLDDIKKAIEFCEAQILEANEVLK